MGSPLASRPPSVLMGRRPPISVRWPAASNCSQNWRMFLVVWLGWSPSNSFSPSSRPVSANGMGQPLCSVPQVPLPGQISVLVTG